MMRLSVLLFWLFAGLAGLSGPVRADLESGINFCINDPSACGLMRSGDCPQTSCPTQTCPAQSCPEQACPTCPAQSCPEQTCPTCPVQSCPEQTCPVCNDHYQDGYIAGQQACPIDTNGSRQECIGNPASCNLEAANSYENGKKDGQQICQKCAEKLATGQTCEGTTQDDCGLTNNVLTLLVKNNPKLTVKDSESKDISVFQEYQKCVNYCATNLCATGQETSDPCTKCKGDNGSCATTLILNVTTAYGGTDSGSTSETPPSLTAADCKAGPCKDDPFECVGFDTTTWKTTCKEKFDAFTAKHTAFKDTVDLDKPIFWEQKIGGTGDKVDAMLYLPNVQVFKGIEDVASDPSKGIELKDGICIASSVAVQRTGPNASTDIGISIFQAIDGWKTSPEPPKEDTTTPTVTDSTTPTTDNTTPVAEQP